MAIKVHGRHFALLLLWWELRRFHHNCNLHTCGAKYTCPGVNCIWTVKLEFLVFARHTMYLRVRSQLEGGKGRRSWSTAQLHGARPGYTTPIIGQYVLQDNKAFGRYLGMTKFRQSRCITDMLLGFSQLCTTNIYMHQSCICFSEPLHEDEAMIRLLQEPGSRTPYMITTLLALQKKRSVSYISRLL